jgi:Domain of unknown function (DUF4279)
LNRTIFLSFMIYTEHDTDGLKRHFDPRDITKKLSIIPIHTQCHQPYRHDNPTPTRPRMPGSPYTASWIYRIGELEGGEEVNYHPELHIQKLLEEFKQQFVSSKKAPIKEILSDYDAHCLLEIYTFGSEEVIQLIEIPSELLFPLTELKIDLNVKTHSKPLNHYLEKAYKYKRLFQ